MLILAFDTTSEVGGVGIFRDADCLALVPNQGLADQYSISLFEMAQLALKQAQFALGDVDLYAAANGPGSFTGIRVGLAAARAWGKVFARPVYGVSVMEAMVYKQGLEAGGWGLGAPTPDWCFPILDARRGEFFLGSFRRRASAASDAKTTAYEAADDGWVLKPDAVRTLLLERTADAGAACVVRAHDQAAVELCASLPASVTSHRVEGVLVDAIAAIAAREQLSGRPCPGAKLDAYYLRRPDAEVKLSGG